MKNAISNTPLVILAMIFSTCAAEAAAPRYAVIALGDLGGSNGSSSVGINQNGELVGSGFLINNQFHAMRWVNGVMIDLNPDLTGSSFAFKNNDVGQIVGEAEFEGQFLKNRAFLWENGQMFDLGTLGGEISEANAINNLGQVVGISNFDPNNPAGWRPFIWQNGVMSSLVPSCEICSGSAIDINNAGEIAGFATTLDFTSHAVYWDTNGIIHDLGTLFNPGLSLANGMNDVGQIVGKDLSGSYDHAVLWEDGKIIDLAPGDFHNSWALAINNNGLIVGIDTNGRDHGALWDSKHREHNLNTLISPLNKWWIGDAYDINDHNQIAANASPRSSGGIFNNFGVVMTPVNPTFRLVEPVPGVAGAVNTIVARGGKLQPGSVVSFYWGVHGGGTLMPNCNMLDAVLQIENARFAGSAVVDDNGVATLEGMIPNKARGQHILIQAVTGPGSPTGCAQSQLVVVKFE